MTIRVHHAISLDGFSASADGLPVLLSMPTFVPGQSYGHDELARQCDAVIMGSTTFEPALGNPNWPWPGRKIFVLTSRPLSAPAGTDVHFRATPAQVVEELRTANLQGDAQVLGGPSTIRAFHELGVVDRLEVVVLPILLGKGTPLFPLGTGEDRLRLEGQERYEDGTVKLSYSTRG